MIAQMKRKIFGSLVPVWHSVTASDPLWRAKTNDNFKPTVKLCAIHFNIK